MFIKCIFALAITLVYVSTAICRYPNVENSPIQIISIQPSTGAHSLPVRRGSRYNKNVNNNIQHERDERGSPITKIIQIRRNSKLAKQQRQFQLGWDNGHGTPLHIAPGAYPVYYVIARANGHFKGDKIRSFKSKQI